VKEGDVLLRLDDAVDRSELGALRADLELAKIEYERVKKLLPKKAVSKSDFDKVEATFQSAAARVDEQGAVVQRKTVRAPFSGLLGIRLVDLGQYLSPGEGIVGLQSLDPIYVDYTLPERYFQRVRVGQDVEVRLDAVPGRVFRGSVVAMESSILEGTRTIRLRAQLKNRDRSLRPGMFAEVETLEGAPREILSLPQTAVSHNTYGDFVLAISEQEDGSLVANPRQVSTGTVREGRVEILEGVQEGDRVVRAGLNKVRPGLPLVIDNQVELRDADLSIR
jgi:membrane fusion protein (multidrug efflux system)